MTGLLRKDFFPTDVVRRPIEPSLSGEKLEGQYPKWKYHASGDAQMVNDPKAEAALGEGWGGYTSRV